MESTCKVRPRAVPQRGADGGTHELPSAAARVFPELFLW